MTAYVTRFPSPVGELILTASAHALTGVYFPTSRHGPPPVGTPDDGAHAVLARTRLELTEYFAGARTTFDLPLDPSGSEFELQVWALLRAIPYGATTTYGDLARRLGDVKLSRAVGAANGKNPIPIIVPCHRVIGANGDLTGFGGGIDRKRWLLEHEGALLALKA
ncbi:MAG TPA: methylated-DNA--[protein]-cysteine S-methyltransferase [Gemmatimonadales bacterium]